MDSIFMSVLITPIVLGQTARDMYDNLNLEGEKLTFGIERRYLTKGVMSTFKTILRNPEISENGIKLCNQDTYWVPVEITFIDRNYEFFKRPDIKSYWLGDYRLPNPFERYWKSRFFIR